MLLLCCYVVKIMGKLCWWCPFVMAKMCFMSKFMLILVVRWCHVATIAIQAVLFKSPHLLQVIEKRNNLFEGQHSIFCLTYMYFLSHSKELFSISLRDWFLLTRSFRRDRRMFQISISGVYPFHKEIHPVYKEIHGPGNRALRLFFLCRLNW